MLFDKYGTIWWWNIFYEFFKFLSLFWIPYFSVSHDSYGYTIPFYWVSYQSYKSWYLKESVNCIITAVTGNSCVYNFVLIIMGVISCICLLKQIITQKNQKKIQLGYLAKNVFALLKLYWACLSIYKLYKAFKLDKGLLFLSKGDVKAR